MGRKKKQKAVVTSSTGKRTIIYLRVSTDDQAQHGYGLDAQRDKCMQYASLVNYIVVDVKSDEGLSGTLPMKERPGLLAAFTACITGDADIILTYEQSRLARDTGIWVNIRDAAIKAGIGLWTVKENTDFATKDSQFMGEIHAVVNAEERRNIAKRLFNGRRERGKDDGLGSGPVPYGYQRIKEIENQEVVTTVHVDQKAQPIINLILRERGKGTPYHKVAGLLMKKGILTPKGNKVWRVSTIQAVESHAELYRTGQRSWDDVESSTQWPIIMEGDN